MIPLGVVRFVGWVVVSVLLAYAAVGTGMLLVQTFTGGV